MAEVSFEDKRAFLSKLETAMTKFGYPRRESTETFTIFVRKKFGISSPFAVQIVAPTEQV